MNILRHKVRSKTFSDRAKATTAVTQHRMQQLGKASARGLRGLFLVRGCPVCDRPSPRVFCIDCQRQIEQAPRPPKQPDSCQIAKTLKTSDAWVPVTALGHYSGTLKQAVLAMKYSDRPEVADPLGIALAQQWRAQQLARPAALTASQSSQVCAVPIPLHTERLHSRGFNQAELIARAFCKASRLPLVSDGLIRVQATQPQHSLGLIDRQKNLSEAFQPGPSLAQYPAHAVLLIDDIYTTGATAISAAMTLRRQGFLVAGIAVVARA